MGIIIWLLKELKRRWPGYLFAVVTVALATWLKHLAQPDIIPANVPILYILAIVLTSFFFTLGPAIVCCIISLFAYDYFFLPPLHSLWSFHILEVPIALIFLCVGVVISYLSSNLRHRTDEVKKELVVRKAHEAELVSYRESLEDLVKQRTAELEKTNLELKNEVEEHQQTERAFRESEELLKRAEEIAHLGSWELDIVNNRLAWSDEVYRVFGVKPEDFGASYEAFMASVHPDDRELIDTAYAASLTSGNDTFEIVHRIIRQDNGEVRYVQEKCRHIRDENGLAIRSLGMVLDITERHQAEAIIQADQQDLERRIFERTRELATVNKALEEEIAEHKTARETIESERQRFYGVLEMLPVYVILLTPDYHVSFANRFFRERFGESRGLRCFEYLFSRNEPCENCETYKVLKTGERHHWAWTGPDKRNYDIFDFPFTDVDGLPLIMEVGIDITEQQKAQDELRQAQAGLETRVEERTRELRETRDYLDNLFNYANAPIVVWNTNHQITRFNHAFERITGLTAPAVLGKKLDLLFPGESLNESMEKIRKATSGERWEVVEIPIKHQDGTVHLLLWNSASIYDADGKEIIATIAQGQDITERKKAEQLKDEFIALVSHELRTPMTVITGSLRTAISPGVSETDKDTLITNAIEGAGSLAAILENLLELSRYQAGRLQLHQETLNLPDIAAGVIARLNARNADHEFLMDFPEDLPKVQADPMRLERIFYNLLENATKYSPAGSRIKVAAWQKDGLVVTGVTDEGTGITPEDMGRIFEPFERLGKKETMRQGLGLGLVVCKRLVEAQGGQIWVKSEPEKGSTFYFSLPVEKKRE